MRGKFVNVCMALLNLLIGVLILIYTWQIPIEITELTVQEYQIINILDIFIYIVFGIVTFLNLIHFFLDMRNGSRRTGYLIAIFSVCFVFMKIWPIAIFSILGSLIILISSLKFRWVETNSYTMISIIVILAIVICFIIGISFIYENLGIYIRDKENEGEIAYRDTYFQYITELEEGEEVYINIKKDGKYGYINSNGDVVIDFIYDYASPFVTITAYDKHFDIALVCQDGRTIIILKNQREVMSYRSESMDDDYEAKISELEDIYYNTLGQTDEMKYEMDINENSNITRIHLDYDENYLYIFSNGTIPFYDVSRNQQGWFTSYGRKITLSGNAQILDFFGDYTLIKNHNDNTIYFINSEGTMVSDVYKEIYIVNEDRFIVKNNSNKYIVINSSFEKVFDGEWDFVDTSLISSGLYIFGFTNGVIEFSDFNYADNMNLQILNSDGTIIASDVNQAYTTVYSISDDTSLSYSERYSNFLDNLRSMNTSFIGDKFYE